MVLKACHEKDNQSNVQTTENQQTANGSTSSSNSSLKPPEEKRVCIISYRHMY